MLTSLEIIIVCIVGFAFVLVGAAPLIVYMIHKFLYNKNRPKEKIPGYDGARQSREGKHFPPEETAKVLDCFKKAWFEEFGSLPVKKRKIFPDITVDSIFNKLDIYWKDELIELGKEWNINNQTVSKASGITDSKNQVRVWVMNYKFVKDSDGNKVPQFFEEKDIKIYKTALRHELIHIVLWNIYDEGDYDHDGPAYNLWNEKHNKVEKRVMELLVEDND